MGWDITYHPLGSDEIAAVYFAGVENPDRVVEFAERYNVPGFHHENLANAFATGRDDDMGGPFATYHGMNMAVVAGHLRKYWYVRGSAMSFLAGDADFTGYFSDFRELVPEAYKHLQFDNQLTQNYCCGVYMDNAALRRLMDDIATTPAVREKMMDLFSHGRFEVFKAAAEYALDEGLGLLEAAEVLEPNPMDLNSSRCLSNLHNCDPAGAILYHEAAMEQIRAIRDQEEEARKDEETASVEQPKKQGFFSRLFGKK